MEIQTEEFLSICRAFAETRLATANSALAARYEKVPPTTAALEWSDTLCDGKSVAYDSAGKACAALGEGWRLPTRMELESILDLTRHNPSIDTTRFPDTKSDWYWTSTPCAWSPGASAWIVHFSNGYADLNRRYHGACVRAVRSVPAGQ